MKTKYSIITGVILFVSIGLFSSCEKLKKTKEDGSENLKSKVVKNFASIVESNYSDALNDALDLEIAINEFIISPSETSHEAVKNAWIYSRESYGQTETFRFMNGPIDDENGPEGNLNAWPLDEGYIDYVYDGITHTIVNNGLIADLNWDITASNLRNSNESGGETNISIGYHAIEFLLWGQDLNYNMTTHTTDYSQAGNRSYTDFVDDPLAERRKTYLKIAMEILIEDLSYLVDAWKDGGWGRTALLGKDTDQAITEIMTGLAMLSKGELAGERMFVALDNQDQEDEHSCFSDNTHRDIYNNALGIKNVYFGNYKLVNGASIKDLIHDLDEETEESLSAHFNTTWETIEGVDQAAPFDGQLVQESVTGTGPIMTAVLNLQLQGDLIVEAANKLGLTVSADLFE